MRKRRVTPIGAAFVALVLLVLLFVVRGALHHPAHISAARILRQH